MRFMRASAHQQLVNTVNKLLSIEIAHHCAGVT